MKKFFNAVTIAKRNAKIYVQTINARKKSINNCLAAMKLTWIVVIRLKMLTASVHAHISLAVGISVQESVEIAKRLVMAIANKNVGED